MADARSTVKTYLETYLDSDNLGTSSFIVCYGLPSYPLTRVFNTKGRDLIFAVMEPQATTLTGYAGVGYSYQEHVPIETFCIDKSGVTGTTLKWSAEAELQRITKAYPGANQYALESREDNDKDIGGTKLYSTRFILNFARARSVTRRAITLGARDGTTGWRAVTYADTAINMLIINRTASTRLLGSGGYVKVDAYGMTSDTVAVGDQVKTAGSVYYEVKAVTQRWRDDTVVRYDCDLTLLTLYEE